MNKWLKYVAMLIFVGMPFMGFYLGVKYQKLINITLEKGEDFSFVLPEGGRIIETESLESFGFPSRVLVLWMINPMARRVESGTCPEYSWGNVYYEGLTRISIVDSQKKEVLDTIVVVHEWDRSGAFELTRGIQRDIWERWFGSSTEETPYITPKFLNPKLDDKDHVFRIARFVTFTTCISKEWIEIEYDPTSNKLTLSWREDIDEAALRARLGEY